jgi:hypothetical protein
MTFKLHVVSSAVASRNKAMPCCSAGRGQALTYRSLVGTGTIRFASSSGPCRVDGDAEELSMRTALPEPLLANPTAFAAPCLGEDPGAARGVPCAVGPFAAALLLGTAMAVAQNITVPAALHGVEGAAGSNVPFGSSLACRLQCIYDAAELPWQGPRVIHGISLRADNGSPQVAGTAIPAKGFLDVSVFLSTTYRTAATMSTAFADNRGDDVTLCLSFQRIQLPAQPLMGVPGRVPPTLI